MYNKSQSVAWLAGISGEYKNEVDTYCRYIAVRLWPWQLGVSEGKCECDLCFAAGREEKELEHLSFTLIHYLVFCSSLSHTHTHTFSLSLSLSLCAHLLALPYRTTRPRSPATHTMANEEQRRAFASYMGNNGANHGHGAPQWPGAGASHGSPYLSSV